jgi:hypothetical protein
MRDSIVTRHLSVALFLIVACQAETHNAGRTLLGIFAQARDDAWAVGEEGATLHWDGDRWIKVDSGTTKTLRAVAGFTSRDLWAVGEAGALHWGGSSWSTFLEPTDLGDRLNGLWAGDRAYTWAVGDLAVFQWNSQSALFDAFGTPSLRGIWGSSATGVWVVGLSGAVAQFRGGELGSALWSVFPGVTSSDLLAVWGSGADDVWAAGENGIIVHWNGSTWSLSQSGTTRALLSVWGTDPTNVWMVGENGTILRWNGTQWSMVASPTDRHLFAVSGSGPNDIWAVGQGGTVLHWAGDAWRSRS